MTNLEIAKEVELLNSQIKHAAATMDYKTSLFELRQKVIALQHQCSHNETFERKEGACPYCGKINK